MKLRRLLLSICCSLVFITGCVEKRIIDDINIATAIGVDKHEDIMKGSIMIPVIKPDQSIENFTFSATGSMMRDAISQMQFKASQPILGGALDVALVEDEIARKGLFQVLDLFLRDPSIGARLILAVVDGKAEKMLQGNYGDRGNHQYLRQLIEHNSKGGNLPQTNLHHFLTGFYQNGQTPYLPYLKQENEQLVNIIGIALFDDEKMVDVLDEKKMFYFKLLVDRFTNGTVMVKDGHGKSKIRSIKSKTKIKLINNNPYHFSIQISINGILTEHHGKVLKKSEVAEIEKELEKQVKKECLTLIESFQQKKIDPVGFGHIAKARTRGFDFEKWDQEDYQNAKFKVTIDAVISEVGVVE